MNRETKNLPDIPVVTKDDGLGKFEGYLAVFGNEDQNGDIIDQGAFTWTLNAAKQRKIQTGSKYLWPLLWQHQEEEPIGGITNAYEDSHGLYIYGEYDLDIPKGQQAYSGAKMGYLDGMSIGYRTVKSTYDTKGVRHLVELQLFEGSMVTFPANDQAMVMSVKSRRFHSADRSYTEAMAARRELEEKQERQRLEWKAAVMALEAKAAAALAGPLGAEIAKRDKRTDEIDTKRAKLRTAIAAMSSLSDPTDSLDQLNAELAKLDQEWDEVNPIQARWRAELRAQKERHELERKARARGERVPSVHDPEAYVAWLQEQRNHPYIELARQLNEQSRRGL